MCGRFIQWIETNMHFIVNNWWLSSAKMLCLSSIWVLEIRLETIFPPKYHLGNLVQVPLLLCLKIVIFDSLLYPHPALLR